MLLYTAQRLVVALLVAVTVSLGAFIVLHLSGDIATAKRSASLTRPAAMYHRRLASIVSARAATRTAHMPASLRNRAAAACSTRFKSAAARAGAPGCPSHARHPAASKLLTSPMQIRRCTLATGSVLGIERVRAQ